MNVPKDKEEAGPSSDPFADVLARTSLSSLGLSGADVRPSRSLLATVAPPGYQLHPIARTDTLAGLAVRYETSVPELLRANRMFAEIEFHGRSSLLVPLVPESELRRERSAKVRGVVERSGLDEAAAARLLGRHAWSVESALRELNAAAAAVIETRRDGLASSGESVADVVADPKGYFGRRGEAIPGRPSSAEGEQDDSLFEL